MTAPYFQFEAKPALRPETLAHAHARGLSLLRGGLDIREAAVQWRAKVNAPGHPKVTDPDAEFLQFIEDWAASVRDGTPLPYAPRPESLSTYKRKLDALFPRPRRDTFMD